MAAKSRLGAIVDAFVFLFTRSLANRVVQRLRRLRQPRYLLGALAGLAYFYFFVFHRIGEQHATSGAHAGLPMTPALVTDFTVLAALALAVLTLGYWLFAGADARLGFSEAEIAFLFPAPITRVTLIHFGLLRSQLGIAFSALVVGVLFRRGAGLGEGPLQFAVAMWLLLSLFQLHALAASFTRQRLRGLGVGPALRRTIVLALAVAVLLGCGWAMGDVLRWPTADTLADGEALRRWFESIAIAPPLQWLLTPFRWVVAPFFAADTATFARALLPALALLAAHYIWAVRAQVSFEEASIIHAQRRAEKLAALRSGRMGERLPTQPRSEPFRLRASGAVPVAYLWKGLIALGPFYRLRTWIILAAAILLGSQWLAADPLRRPLLTVIGAAVAGAGGWLLMLGPMMVQRGMRRTLEQMDILKAMPLRGWQIALGELLTPMTVMSFAAWLLLLLGVEALAHAERPLLPTAIAIATLGVAAVLPPLCGLMLSLPFAGVLYFPAWFGDGGAGGNRGIEVMGQRLLFMGGYVLVLLAALLPVALLGVLGFWLGQRLVSPNVGLLIAVVLAWAVLVFELVCAIDLLGRRIDRFDVSQELR